MGAKDLMLNDLVLFNNKVCKIVATNAYRDCVELYDVNDEDNEVIGKYAKHIEPILLTEEILKKNGFFRNMPNSNCWMYVEHWAKEEGEDKCDVYVHLHEDSYFLEIENSYNDDALYERTLHFVHECQHALRLCGCKLANNFKV